MCVRVADLLTVLVACLRVACTGGDGASLPPSPPPLTAEVLASLGSAEGGGGGDGDAEDERQVVVVDVV